MTARAPSLASGATASSRSKISPSAGKSRAFSSARGFEAGMNNRLRRGRIGAAVAVAFMRLKAGFDGAPQSWESFLFVDDMANLVFAIVVLAILGLVGLFVAAAHETGGLHNGGVALFLVAALFVLLNLKRVFDTAEAHR